MTRTSSPLARAALLPSVLLLDLALAGCGELQQGVEEGIELGKREGVMEVLGKAELQLKAGLTIPGELSCRVAETGTETTPVTCGAITSDNRNVSLTGTITSVAGITEADWIRGDFVATVNGDEVLRAPCLGNC